ncbi:hypothetical protein JHK82_057030 [Glycine max]|nr:hypothetical protein JHK84_056922 [Glycine max]KAG5078335.1 hypothetical protein JHK82_057030 [Glycine max]
MTTVTGELKWLKGLLHGLGISHSQPMRLHCDNQVTFYIVKNPIFHEHTKHIEVDYHFIRDEYLTSNIAPTYVPTHAQLVDIFTKTFGPTQFTSLLCKLVICNSHAPT